MIVQTSLDPLLAVFSKKTPSAGEVEWQSLVGKPRGWSVCRGRLFAPGLPEPAFDTNELWNGLLDALRRDLRRALGVDVPARTVVVRKNGRDDRRLVWESRDLTPNQHRHVLSGHDRRGLDPLCDERGSILAHCAAHRTKGNEPEQNQLPTRELAARRMRNEIWHGDCWLPPH